MCHNLGRSPISLGIVPSSSCNNGGEKMIKYEVQDFYTESSIMRIAAIVLTLPYKLMLFVSG